MRRYLSSSYPRNHNRREPGSHIQFPRACGELLRPPVLPEGTGPRSGAGTGPSPSVARTEPTKILGAALFEGSEALDQDGCALLVLSVVPIPRRFRLFLRDGRRGRQGEREPLMVATAG